VRSTNRLEKFVDPESFVAIMSWLCPIHGSIDLAVFSDPFKQALLGPVVR
jgi:hypothetical protein